MPKLNLTKIDMVRSMQERPDGVALNAICKSTGWQPHSARAAISGLRKSGHVIERTSGIAGSGSVYRITDIVEVAS